MSPTLTLGPPVRPLTSERALATLLGELKALAFEVEERILAATSIYEAMAYGEVYEMLDQMLVDYGQRLDTT